MLNRWKTRRPQILRLLQCRKRTNTTSVSQPRILKWRFCFISPTQTCEYWCAGTFRLRELTMTRLSSSLPLLIAYISSTGYITPLKVAVWGITILSIHLQNKTKLALFNLLSSLYLYQSHISRWDQPLSVKVCAQPLWKEPLPSLIFHCQDRQISRNILSLSLSKGNTELI